jgi:hypothetical protein
MLVQVPAAIFKLQSQNIEITHSLHVMPAHVLFEPKHFSDRLSVDYNTGMIQKSTVSNNNAMPRRATFCCTRPASFPSG